jgi:4-hydroxy-4-methyl-2-oxoglutarate aldolase
MTAMDVAAVAERYRRLETALVYDVLDTMGLPNQQLSLAIQPLHYEMVVAGPAFTHKLAVSEAGTKLVGGRQPAIEAGFPVFSRFSSCTFSRNRRRLIDYEIPIRVSGHLTKWVTVNPGDFVFGDADGILVIPRELTVEVLEAAERVREHEEWQREQLSAGVPRREVYKIDRYAHCRRLSAEEIARYTA